MAYLKTLILNKYFPLKDPWNTPRRPEKCIYLGESPDGPVAKTVHSQCRGAEKRHPVTRKEDKRVC